MIIMAVQKTGISHNLLIHPGETLAEVLEEREISQAELAAGTGVSAAYVNSVIKGKKGISAKFAMGLEYVLNVPKSFWLNLQANYDSELLELNEGQTIAEEERYARNELAEVVKYLRLRELIPMREKKDDSILSLRKALQISNIANLKNMVPAGAFRMPSEQSVNPYVLGAWVRLCQIKESRKLSACFDIKQTGKLIGEMKQIMLQNNTGFQDELKETMENYGIDFAIVKNFRGAPVQGYISQKNDGAFQMFLTIRGSFADIFWFSLFHELGHIVNGDIGKVSRFVDDGSDGEKELAADRFARDALLEPVSYRKFIEKGDFSIEAVEHYASSQNVMPYIVIGRLQKEEYLDYRSFSSYKLRYKWAKPTA